MKQICFSNSCAARLRQCRLFCDFVSSVPKYVTSDEPIKPKKKVFEMTQEEIAEQLQQNLIQLRKDFAKDEGNNIVVPIFKKAFFFADQVAIKDTNREYTYIQLYVSAKKLGYQISNLCGSGALFNVAYVCSNNALSLMTQWACWMSGQVAMPLNTETSIEELTNVLKVAKPRLLIATPEYAPLVERLSPTLDCLMVIIDHSFMEPDSLKLTDKHRLLLPGINAVLVEGSHKNDFYDSANALLLYKRGPYNYPRGVMLTHRNLDFQAKSLINIWQITSSDCLLHALPANNASGFYGAFLGALSVGAKIMMHEKFVSTNVWNALLSVKAPAKDRVNVFLAVPSMYEALIGEYEKSLAKNKSLTDYVLNYCKSKVRSMVSGAAPLSRSVYKRWFEITGHRLVDCYSLTEAGVVLSNKPQSQGVEGNEGFLGTVGLPLPNVQMRLVDKTGKSLVKCHGELKDGKWIVVFDTVEGQKIVSESMTDVDQTVPEKSKDNSTQTNVQVKKPSKTLTHRRPSSDLNQRPSFEGKIIKMKTGLTKIELEDKINAKSRKPTENPIYNLVIQLNKSETPLVQLSYKADDNRISAECLQNLLDIFMREVKRQKVQTGDKVKIDESKGDDHVNRKDVREKSEKQSEVDVQEKNPLTKTLKSSVSKVNGKDHQKPLLGFIEISSPTIFREYYKEPQSSAVDFQDGFYKTGDVAVYRNGSFQVIGSLMVDHPKLGRQADMNSELESLILEHPSVKDVSVIVAPLRVGSSNSSEAMGTIEPTGSDSSLKPVSTESQYEGIEQCDVTKVGVVCVLKANAKLDLSSLKTFCCKSMPEHLLPQWLKVVDELPRSDGGEINKQKLLQQILGEQAGSNDARDKSEE